MPTQVQVRLKQPAKSMLPPVTVLMGGLATSALIHGNAGHEFGGLSRCPDDPLNEMAREVPGCFPGQVRVLMYHCDGADEPTLSRAM